MTKHTKTCRGFVTRYLGREWTRADGLKGKDVEKAEARLGIRLPAALKDFYLSVGAVPDLCSIHNIVFHPRDLIIEEGYLLFMDEYQSVVSWGIKRKDLSKADPAAWQRNNSAEKWYSERKSFTQLLISMFDWYQELGVWKPRPRSG